MVELRNVLLSGNSETGAGDLAEVAVDKGLYEHLTLLVGDVEAGAGSPL